MNRSWKTLGRAVVSVATAVALTACGGGGDDHITVPPVTSEVPGSASQSVGGFISYLQALVVTEADAFEPVDTSVVTAPTDETSEPLVVN